MRSLHARRRCGRAAQVCPYGCGALRRFYKFHFIQKPRAEGVFRKLAKYPFGQSRTLPASWRFSSVGCLFAPQVAVCAIVKNVADAILNRGCNSYSFAQCLRRGCFPLTCEIHCLGKVVRYPRRGVSRRRLLVYFTGHRLRNSKKNVADFNFELLIIYQVYCIIIVTREKRFARKGTRATTESLCATGLRRF